MLYVVDIASRVALGSAEVNRYFDCRIRSFLSTDEPRLAVLVDHDKTDMAMKRQHGIRAERQRGGVGDATRLPFRLTTAFRFTKESNRRYLGEHSHHVAADALQVNAPRQLVADHPTDSPHTGQYLC